MGMYKLKSYEKQAIWGGKKLNTEYGKKSFEEIAESWELSGFIGKESAISEGDYKGLTMNELINMLGSEQLLGTKAPKDGTLPILIKLIDSAAPLSIQVHPDAVAAKELGDGAASKTEAWVICESEEDAYLYFGLNKDMTEQELSDVLEKGTLTEYLNRVQVKKGDVFFIPSGTIHAIGAGITICEIQQTSDTTYRLYDYGRIDKDGKPRQLHIKEGTRAANLTALTSFHSDLVALSDGGEFICGCEFFNVYRRYGGNSFEVDNTSFSALTFISGSGTISNGSERLLVNKGDTVLVSAGSGEIKLDGNSLICIDTRL